MAILMLPRVVLTHLKAGFRAALRPDPVMIGWWTQPALPTPIFVMLDLDIGMNDWLVEPLSWDEGRRHDRGKVMTAEMLDAGVEFGRYLDVDGDGIPYRTYPGRIRHAAPFSPAAPARTATRGIPRKVPTTSTTCSGCCTNSRLRNAWCHARSSARHGSRPASARFISARPRRR